MKSILLLTLFISSIVAFECKTIVEYLGPIMSFLNENRQTFGGFRHIAVTGNFQDVDEDTSALSLVAQWSLHPFSLWEDKIPRANDTLFVVDIQIFNGMVTESAEDLISRPVLILTTYFEIRHFEGLGLNWRLDDRIFVFSHDHAGSLYEIYGVRTRLL